MNSPVIILGRGGHARVVIDALILKGISILGFTVPDYEREIGVIGGIELIGNDEMVLKYTPTSIQLANGLGTVKDTSNRERVFNYFKSKGYQFIEVVHPSSVIAPDVTIGEGVQIMAGAIIQTGSRIGQNTIINTKTSVDHDCLIGSHVHLAPGVTLSGGVKVDDGALIGTGVTIIQGVCIGRNSIIGAGSLVIKNIPEGVTAIGSPAKVVSL